MSRDLTDVLHAFVDDRARASAAEGPDPAQRARTVAALVRRRRTRRVGGLAAASVALLAAGAVAASALTGPEPQPAVPEPSVTTSAAPSPSMTPSTAVTTTTAPSPTPTATPGPWARGVVDSVLTPPTRLWTVSATEVVTEWQEQDPPLFSNVDVGDVRAGTAVIDAGSTVVTLVEDAHGFDQRVVGLDAVTGMVRWTRGEDHERPVHRCAGTSPDGLVVCWGATSSGAGGAPELQLLDPATGEVVRGQPLEFPAESGGLSGSVLVLHAGTGPDATDVRWTGIDVSTGDVLFSHTEPGRGEAYEVTGDPPAASTVVSGPYARLDGYFYSLAIDVRTGAELVRQRDLLVNFDMPVWAPTDPESVPVFDWWDPETGDPAPLRGRNPADGTVLWKQDAPGFSPRAVVGDLLLAGDLERTSALDATTGRVLWTVPVSGDIVATDGRHVLMGDGAVLSLDDGSVLITPLAAGPGRVFGERVLGGSNHLAGGGGETLTLFRW